MQTDADSKAQLGEGSMPSDDLEEGSIHGQRFARLLETIKTVAALVMFMSPGVATAFYVVMVGYYQAKFHSRIFFIAMLLAVYGPYPLVTALSATFDGFFDRWFSTSTTYMFRIVTAQLLLVCLTFVWMYTVPTPGAVIGIGVAVGTAAAVANVVGHQLVSAIDPQKLIHAEIGGQFGQALPLIVFAIAAFKPDASVYEFRGVLSTIFYICALSIATLVTFHYCTVFEQAYQRLSYDLSQSGGQQQEFVRQCSEQVRQAKLLDEPSNICHEQAVSRQCTPIAPEPASSATPKLGEEPAKLNIPNWVYIWMVTKFAMTALQAATISIASYFGGPGHTQFLACLKLAADFLGRLLALPACKSTYFAMGPQHMFLAATIVIRIAVSLCVFSELITPWISNALFAAMWSALAFLDRFCQTLVDVTAGSHVQVRDRKFVSRLTFFSGFGGLIVGFSIAAAVVLSLFGTEDPPSSVAREHQALFGGVVLASVRAASGGGGDAAMGARLASKAVRSALEPR